MRNADKIDAVLTAIKKTWEQYPELRLGQLLVNVIPENAIYYMEDDELKKRLVDFYTKPKEN